MQPGLEDHYESRSPCPGDVIQLSVSSTEEIGVS